MKVTLTMTLVLAALMSTACSTGPNAESLASTYVAETAAAQAAAASATPLPTDTPAPTETPLPSATSTLTPTETTKPTFTATSTLDAAATRAAQATQLAESMLAKIEPVLLEHNLPTDTGKIGWIQEEPVELYIDSYNTIVYDHLTPLNQDFGEFVLFVDITWSSKMGFAGCGLTFLAEKKLDYGEQYRFYTMRFSGLPAWDLSFFNYDEYQYSTIGDIRFNNAINLQDDSTNNYVLIHKDRMLSLYANGIRLGVVDITSRSKGVFGIFGYQESGKTSCIFDNTWVWELE